jgi:thymidylate synthase
LAAHIYNNHFEQLNCNCPEPKPLPKWFWIKYKISSFRFRRFHSKVMNRMPS